MKTFLALLVVAGIPFFLSAQNCPCTEQFDWLRQKLALNYSGYSDKVTPQNQDEFDRHTALFRTKIAAATTDTACLRLMTEWGRWFRDGHVQLYLKAGSTADDPTTIRQRYAAWEKISITEAEARNYLDQPGRDPAEGIYQNAEGNYRIVLLKKPTPQRDFAAIILRADSVWWMPGQVKFDLKQTAPNQYASRYYMRDHSERNPAGTLSNGKLAFEGLGAWYKQYPGAPVAPPVAQIFTLQQPDDSTLLLTVPTMNEGVRLQLDSLVQANQARLERTPNLIIDCRGNGGGSDITFNPLLPYVLTGPVKGYRGQIYATDDNIQKYELARKNKDFPTKYRLYFGHMARKMRRNKGEYVGKCGTASIKVKKLKPYPRQVAILTDGGCASSCEQFVYYARQSKRVTLVGQNTAGIMDYGNLHNLDFPCGGFGLAYPTSRSCRVDAGQAIDGTGMPPEIRIEEKDADWIQIARDYLKQKQ